MDFADFAFDNFSKDLKGSQKSLKDRYAFTKTPGLTESDRVFEITEYLASECPLTFV